MKTVIKDLGIMRAENREEIYNIIPNRYPLMILDELEVEPGIKAVSKKKLSKDDWFFECHYPDNPILPGCLIIESLTQVFSSTFLSLLEEQEIPVISRLGGTEPIVFKEGLTIGDTVRFEAQLSSFRRGIAKGHCTAIKETDNGDVIISDFDIVDMVTSQMIRPR